jgi:uncharacterized Zn finger protein (UPF0148 family)
MDSVTCPVCGHEYTLAASGRLIPTHFVMTKPASMTTEPCAGSRTPLVEEQGSLF